MTISRRSMLLGGTAAAAAAALPSLVGRASAQAPREGKNLIVILAYGGWDVTYAFDPKPGIATIDVPEGDVQSFGDLNVYTHASRPNVTSFFEAYGHISAVMNGVQVQSIVHPDCTKRILTGTASDANADLSAIVAFEKGRELPAPYLVLGPTAYAGPYASISARAGTVNQIRGLLDPQYAFPGADSSVDRFVPDEAEEGLIRKYVESRAARDQAIRGQQGYNLRRFEDFKSSLVRGDALKVFKDGFGDDFAFTLDLNTQIQLALDAIEGGVCHSVHLEQAFAMWDTHANNDQQAYFHEDMFAALSNLAGQLSSRPGKEAGRSMMDETVVAVLSEMSRTPKLNDDAGKDHWPVTSALVFGGGIAGGRSYGASDDTLMAMNIDYASGAPSAEGKQLMYTNLVAGLLEGCGVDASAHLPNSEPFTAFLV